LRPPSILAKSAAAQRRKSQLGDLRARKRCTVPPLAVPGSAATPLSRQPASCWSDVGAPAPPLSAPQKRKRRLRSPVGLLHVSSPAASSASARASSALFEQSLPSLPVPAGPLEGRAYPTAALAVLGSVQRRAAGRKADCSSACAHARLPAAARRARRVFAAARASRARAASSGGRPLCGASSGQESLASGKQGERGPSHAKKDQPLWSLSCLAKNLRRPLRRPCLAAPRFPCFRLFAPLPEGAAALPAPAGRARTSLYTASGPRSQVAEQLTSAKQSRAAEQGGFGASQRWTFSAALGWKRLATRASRAGVQRREAVGAAPLKALWGCHAGKAGAGCLRRALRVAWSGKQSPRRRGLGAVVNGGSPRFCSFSVPARRSWKQRLSSPPAALQARQATFAQAGRSGADGEVRRKACQAAPLLHAADRSLSLQKGVVSL